MVGEGYAGQRKTGEPFLKSLYSRSFVQKHQLRMSKVSATLGMGARRDELELTVKKTNNGPGSIFCPLGGTYCNRNPSKGLQMDTGKVSIRDIY